MPISCVYYMNVPNNATVSQTQGEKNERKTHKKYAQPKHTHTSMFLFATVTDRFVLFLRRHSSILQLSIIFFIPREKNKWMHKHIWEKEDSSMHRNIAPQKKKKKTERLACKRSSSMFVRTRHCSALNFFFHAPIIVSSLLFCQQSENTIRSIPLSMYMRIFEARVDGLYGHISG